MLISMPNCCYRGFIYFLVRLKNLYLLATNTHFVARNDFKLDSHVSKHISMLLFFANHSKLVSFEVYSLLSSANDKFFVAKELLEMFEFLSSL